MSQPANVWIIDDDRSIRWVLERALNQAGMQPRVFDSGESIMMRLEHEQPDAIVSDIRMPGVDGITLLSQIVDVHPDVPVIIMTAHSDLESAVTSYQTGAFEYLPKPFDVDDAVALVKRAVAHSHEKRASGEPQAEMAQRNAEIIGEAPAMQEVFRAIGRLSHSNITVLINGESGTGKELVAQALHNHSPRANHPFIALNMAAIPKDLIESELFGHEKGAFTGAGAARQGRFEQANGGTLFLDEIGDMPADTQTRLLRVLADGEFYRVGGTTPIKVDVRIIAATHQDLEKLVQAGTFREDLFHRLNVIRVHLPKLAERREDIPRLMQHFLKRAAKELAVEPKILREEAEEYLTTLPWPGNVRQLENAVFRAVVLCDGDTLRPQDFQQISGQMPDIASLPAAPVATSTEAAVPSASGVAAAGEGPISIMDPDGEMRALQDIERDILQYAIDFYQGHMSEVSRRLGIGRSTLYRKVREYDLDMHEREAS